jgi:hypothetical protein
MKGEWMVGLMVELMVELLQGTEWVDWKVWRKAMESLLFRLLESPQPNNNNKLNE